MPDREKVIKGLECCTFILGKRKCSECPYQKGLPDNGCYQLQDDFHALLQEQEAENGEWITIWREDDPDTSTHARCSICNRISERPLGGYCKWCGSKMSQEWGVDG